MSLAWISEQTAIISLYSINLSVFITEAECFLRGTNWVLKSDVHSFVLKGLIYMSARKNFHHVVTVFRRSTFKLARLSPIGRWQQKLSRFLRWACCISWLVPWLWSTADVITWQEIDEIGCSDILSPTSISLGLKSGLHGENSAYYVLLLWQLPRRFTDDFLPGYLTLWPVYAGPG